MPVALLNLHTIYIGILYGTIVPGFTCCLVIVRLVLFHFIQPFASDLVPVAGSNPQIKASPAVEVPKAE